MAVYRLDLGEIKVSRYKKEIRCYCGLEPHGTLEVLTGICDTYVDEETNEVGYGDNGTEIDWDSGSTAFYKGLPVLMCKDGHFFVHRGVTTIN